MKRVAIVIYCVKRLKGRPNVIERNFLRVQGSSAGLDMVFEFLGSLIGFVFQLHGFCPNPPSDAADDRIFWIDAIGEEKGQIGCEIIDIHPSRHIIFDVGKSIGERESQLGDGIIAIGGGAFAFPAEDEGYEVDL